MAGPTLLRIHKTLSSSSYASKLDFLLVSRLLAQAHAPSIGNSRILNTTMDLYKPDSLDIEEFSSMSVEAIGFMQPGGKIYPRVRS